MSSKLKTRIIVAIALVFVFVSTTASSCNSPECDIAGPKTALTTCLAQEISK